MKKLFDPNISHELLAEFDNEVDKLELLRSLAIYMLSYSVALQFCLKNKSLQEIHILHTYIYTHILVHIHTNTYISITYILYTYIYNIYTYISYSF